MVTKALSDDYYKLLEDIQTLDFTLVELNLYLDTHPDDLEAIKQFNTYTQKAKELRQQFEENFGPLMHFGHSYSTHPWAWNEPPWPWQV